MTHWAVRPMAKEFAISYTSAQPIWRQAGIKPHLVKTVRFSNDPEFEEEVVVVVGLVHEPAGQGIGAVRW